MVTENLLHQEWQPCGDLWYRYDSRYVKVVAVLDEVIMNAELGSGERAGQGLQHLLSNSLEQARAENRQMQAICYPESAEHELDHFRICTTIAALCCRWPRSRVSLNDLQELRALVSRHISSFDHPFEHYLLAWEFPAVTRELPPPAVPYPITRPESPGLIPERFRTDPFVCAAHSSLPENAQEYAV